MFAPEEQQIEICLLKSNLAEIENDLVVQRSALPALDVESEQQYRETMNALRIARSINAEVERLKQENVRLIAKRMQLKRQCEDVSKALENARENRNNLLKQLNLEEKEEEEEIRKYEDTLREKAERFRKARVFYNEEEMNIEIQNISATNTELSSQVKVCESTADGLYQQLDSLNALVPDDVMDIFEKDVLSNNLKELTDQCTKLEERRSNLHTTKIKHFQVRRANNKI